MKRSARIRRAPSLLPFVYGVGGLVIIVLAAACGDHGGATGVATAASATPVASAAIVQERTPAGAAPAPPKLPDPGFEPKAGY